MDKAIKTELAKTGKELSFMLSSKQAKHPVENGGSTFFHRHQQLQAQKVLMVQPRLC